MNLEALRLKHKFTQEALAERVGLSRAAYTNIENGKRRPSPEAAQRIGEALGFDWTRFFTTETDDGESEEERQ